ncbi:MAG: AsnC family transcriptional regulator [Clostridia bacterium]|jgi:Lrp/AsnC family leucine-responsive transcriptional regulator|nr:AsnC family transcriptional regulator [Clostridia bacterium]
MIDEIDLKIIEELKKDSKISNKDIGAKINMSGQAVGQRISKLLENDVITNFTINTDNVKLGINNIAYITVYMETADHSKMKYLIEHTKEIVEAHRISGEGCYILKIESEDNKIVSDLVDSINTFANYGISTSINKLK